MLTTVQTEINELSPRRGRGRPPSRVKKIPVTVALTPEAYEKLEAYASAKGLYKGQVLCELIRKLKLETET